MIAELPLSGSCCDAPAAAAAAAAAAASLCSSGNGNQISLLWNDPVLEGSDSGSH